MPGDLKKCREYALDCAKMAQRNSKPRTQQDADQLGSDVAQPRNRA